MRFSRRSKRIRMVRTRHGSTLAHHTSIKPIAFFQFLFLLAAAVTLAVNVVIPSYTQNFKDWLPPDIAPSADYLSLENGRLTWRHKPAGVGIRLSDVTDLKENRTRVLLVVVVSTAPVRQERRDAIRDTWWRRCRTGEVICRFFTDGLVTNKHLQKKLLEERARYHDIEFQPLTGGMEFGYRFLFHIQWATAKYDFDFFLRADDDYFVCLDKLIHELPRRPKQNLCWGYFHCFEDAVWLDEAWMVFSRDIIERFLAQDARTMLCHPHADQQIAMWLNNISERLYFHDERLYHIAPESFEQKVINVCGSLMGIHQAYASRMRIYGSRSFDGARKYIPRIIDFSEICPHYGFDFTTMDSPFFFEPRPCVKNPSWRKSHRLWIGSEGKT